MIAARLHQSCRSGGCSRPLIVLVKRMALDKQNIPAGKGGWTKSLLQHTVLFQKGRRDELGKQAGGEGGAGWTGCGW